MKKISVKLLQDEHDCEYCGWDLREGYVIEVDGKEVVDKSPIAHCYDFTSYSHDGYWNDVRQLLESHFAERFPSELRLENAVGEEPEYNEDAPEEYEQFELRRKNYSTLLLNFINKNGIVFEVEWEFNHLSEEELLEDEGPNHEFEEPNET